MNKFYFWQSHFDFIEMTPLNEFVELEKSLGNFSHEPTFLCQEFSNFQGKFKRYQKLLPSQAANKLISDDI